MEVKQAIEIAKHFVRDVMADERLIDVSVEETEFHSSSGHWSITLGVYRAGRSLRTRAQEVLESLGAVASLSPSYKVVTLDGEGAVLSMKNKPASEVV